MLMTYLTKDQDQTLRNVKMRMRALENPLRQRILHLIKSNRNHMNVTDIYMKLRIEQSTASQHLSILRRAGFVKAAREGKTIWYSVNDKAINRLVEVLEYIPKPPIKR